MDTTASLRARAGRRRPILARGTCPASLPIKVRRGATLKPEREEPSAATQRAVASRKIAIRMPSAARMTPHTWTQLHLAQARGEPVRPRFLTSRTTCSPWALANIADRASEARSRPRRRESLRAEAHRRSSSARS
jgi:hypothetical protein